MPWYRKAVQCLLGAIFSFQQQNAVISADPLSACPPSSDVKCPSGEAVECNSSRFQSCIYDSLCDAQNSHNDFNEVTCTRRKLAKFIYCPAHFKPVKCRKDQDSDFQTFENSCLAESEGGYSSDECCNVNHKICPEVYDPVECRGDMDNEAKICTYENYCKARGAGYQKDDCIFTETHSNLQDHECEAASKDAKEECEGKPMRNLFCGPNKCPMDNVCVANKMGWKKFQCTNEDGCRFVKRKAACDKSYNPVICSANKKCEYANPCVARKGAGYKLGECVFKKWT